MSPVEMPMVAIRLDPRTWVRDRADDDVVVGYATRMAAGVSFPPIAVFYDDDGYYVADGFRRYRAALLAGRPTIWADPHHGDRIDALWYALGANQADGMPLSLVDRQHAMEVALVADWAGRHTQIAIANRIGVATSTLRHHATVLAAAGRIQRHTYPAPAIRRLQPEPPADDAKRALIMPDRSPAALQARHAQMRELAASQHTTRQIAAAVGLSWGRCKHVLKQLAIEVPADRVMGKTQRHSATRIVSSIVMDAVNLTEGADLVDFSTLDHTQIAEWVRSLQASREQLGTFIRRLIKEQTQHGDNHEAA